MMTKEVKVKARRGTAGNLVLFSTNIPPYLREKVNKLKLGDDFILTLSVPDPRGDWIKKWYKKAKKDDDVVFHHHKTVTICTPHWHASDNFGFGISDVCNGDTYDRKTGIAVAYAKFWGEPIPDFI